MAKQPATVSGLHTSEPEAPNDRLIDVREALRKFGNRQSRSAIYRAISDHGFPHGVKIGSRRFWSEREVDAWILRQLRRRTF